MNALQFLGHLLSFLAPAFALALVLALFGRWLGSAGAPRAAWWKAAAINFVVGVAVLAAGLWFFGRDGKMATYGALVAVMATTQWLIGRGWRS